LGEDNINMQTEKKLHGMVLASLAAILSVVIFGLRFSFIELIGFVLIFVSIFILEKRL